MFKSKKKKKKGIECNKFLLILVIAAVILVIGLLIAKLYVNKQANKESVRIEINCEGELISRTFKEGNTIDCHILDDYTFTIKKINKDSSVLLEANDYGLTDGASLIEKKKEFTIYKDQVLKLTTQTTDYQECVTFEIK